jgi:hypothetical protein
MITCLAFGAGQDSTAILYKITLDPQFKTKYVKGRFIVIMCDTGDEHEATYDHVRVIKIFCRHSGIEFHFIKGKDGYHHKHWTSLIHWMKTYDSIMSLTYPKSCTDNLKIKPFYNFLDHLIGKEYYHQDLKPSKSRKRFIKRFASENGKIRILLGIAKEEESRVAETFPHQWMRNCLERIYPLIEEGMNRHDCQNYINAIGLPLPPPSNCQRCPYLSPVELVWLHRFYPKILSEWITLEKAKLKKWRRLGLPESKNAGVFGKKLLPEVLQGALHKYGHLTDRELQEYKTRNGHCVKSRY